MARSGKVQPREPAGAPYEPTDKVWRAAERTTYVVAAAIYGGFVLLTWHYHALPWWLVLPLGGALVAWQGSLQHETIHGHPSRSQMLNDLLAFPVLWLWMPYGIYRDSHLAHHRTAWLTCPLEDPESFYVTPERWRRMPALQQLTYRRLNSLAGRMLLGPWVAVGRLFRTEIGRMVRGDLCHVRHWLVHVLALGLVLGWAVYFCGIPFVEYVLLFAYPGLALTLIRSFWEHRPAAEPSHRTVLVDAGPAMSLLFLNNNLHAVHHERPELPWRLIAPAYRAEAERYAEANDNFRFAGYGELFRRYFWRTKDRPEHPGFGEMRG